MLHNTNQKTNNPIYGKELKTKQIFEIVEMSCKKEKKIFPVQCIMSAHTVLNYYI